MGLNMNDRGIDCTGNYNDLLSSTLIIDSNAATYQQCDLSHNVSSDKTLCTIAISTMSTKTSSTYTSAKVPQTTTLVHAGSQVLVESAIEYYVSRNYAMLSEMKKTQFR